MAKYQANIYLQTPDLYIWNLYVFLCKKILYRETRRGWRAWRLVDSQIRRKLCNARATRVLGLRIIAEKMDRVVCRIVEKKYVTAGIMIFSYFFLYV